MDVTSASERAKRERVLDGALQAFLTYGYKRVTMDEIARASDMSRPALYLIFRNKADIYRAISDRLFDLSLDRVDLALKGDGALADRLYRSIDEAIISMVQQINASPHGAELIDLKGNIATDLIAGWHNAMSARFRDAIVADARKRGVDLAKRGVTATNLAEMLVDGLEGMKRRVGDVEAQRAGARHLVRVIELAVAG